MEHPALLPNGFLDLMPADAGRETEAVYLLMKEFQGYGYSRVKPPLLEFEDSLLAPGPGQSLAQETFRLMDPVSQRMLGIRSDCTPQIARIAASRLAGAPRPLRLCYAGDVLRIRGTQLRPERQFGQAGCELFGSASAEADIEIAVLAVKGLDALGVRKLSLDLTIPALTQKIFDACKTSEPVRAAIAEALGRRDRDGLAKCKKDKAAEIFMKLLDLSGPAKDALVRLKKLGLPKSTNDELKRLGDVAGRLETIFKSLGLDAGLTFDPVEQRGFGYETGISFTVFAKNVRGELGRGGRYESILGAGTKNEFRETATGFTLYMDTVRGALPEREAPQSILAGAQEKWSRLEELRAQGWQVVRDIGGKQTGCTHELRGGKIEKLKNKQK